MASPISMTRYGRPCVAGVLGIAFALTAIPTAQAQTQGSLDVYQAPVIVGTPATVGRR